MKKKSAVITMLLFMMFFIRGCGATETSIYYDSYNELEDSIWHYHAGDGFSFKVNDKGYRVMDGLMAQNLEIIDDTEEPGHVLVLVDYDRTKFFSLLSEEEYYYYYLKAIRACTDTDGKVYILYSVKGPGGGIFLTLDYLMSSHILEMDMENFQIKNQYDFGMNIFVLTVRDGYVYTVDGGKVYRELLGGTDDREYMANLGYSGLPKREEISSMKFYTEADGVKIMAYVMDEADGRKKVLLADVKYTDEPLKSRRHFRDRIRARQG